MSNKGIFTALSGSMAQMKQMDTIANNIANANSPSFKRDVQVFQEYMTVNEKEPEVLGVPKVPASVESFYDMQGKDKGYVDTIGTYIDFSQGAVKKTGNPFDVALEGEGFFQVLTSEGVRYTRSGQFSMDAQGTLVTQSGFPVLQNVEDESLPLQKRVIRWQGGDLQFDRKGRIYNGKNLLGQLAVKKFDDQQSLRKDGQGLYHPIENTGVNPLQVQNFQIHQGALEMSNINLVREMTEMIAATRSFEGTQKVIKAYDEMNAKLVNEIPKL